MVDGQEHDGDYLAVEVLNIRFAGPNVPVAPDADPCDGQLEVVLLRPDDRDALRAYLDERVTLASGAIPEVPIVRGAVLRLRGAIGRASAPGRSPVAERRPPRTCSGHDRPRAAGCRADRDVRETDSIVRMDSTSAGRRVASVVGLGGAVGAVAVDALYIAAIIQQGATPPGGRVPFVAIWITVAALIAGIGAFTWDPRRRAILLAVSAAWLLTLAVPGIWSIGVPLFICAMAAGLGATRAAEELRLPWWVILLAPTLLVAAAGVILFAGFALTQGLRL
jgi:hypothetical protein